MKKIILALLLLMIPRVIQAQVPVTQYTQIQWDEGPTTPGNCLTPAFFYNTTVGQLLFCRGGMFTAAHIVGSNQLTWNNPFLTWSGSFTLPSGLFTGNGFSLFPANTDMAVQAGQGATLIRVFPNSGNQTAGTIYYNIDQVCATCGSNVASTATTQIAGGTTWRVVASSTTNAIPITTMDIGEGLGSAGVQMTLIRFLSGNAVVAGLNLPAGTFFETLTTPASSSAACTVGTFTDDTNFHYVCVATNTWKRVAITTW